MRKRYIFPAVGLLGAGAAATYFLKNKSKANEESSTIDKAGIPDQIEKENIAQLENAKMVSEGSQYGVQYYNSLRE